MAGENDVARGLIRREVIVYDYVDSGVTTLARMALKRQMGYRSLGYEIGTAAQVTSQVVAR